MGIPPLMKFLSILPLNSYLQKGGPSIEVLLDLALGQIQQSPEKLQRGLNTSFLYEADTDRLEEAYKGDEIAKEIIESYAKAEFYKLLN